MDALQYIYTSWKNGNSTEKGYMIYSRSAGISEVECGAIKDAMQYMAPKELNLTPSPQEIADVFPYAFAYFLLPTGRGCVAQSTYLGKDYSGRFGNYIIYALVFDVNDLPCRPAELFAEPYIKTAMTEEELNAPSPVPPLPPLRITQYSSVINDDQLNEFLYDKEEEFAQVISMVIAARAAGIPFYLNDTRENLVLWSAAVQRILPFRMAKKFMFNTYIGDHESMRSPRMKEEGLNFHIIGVRPDANYFNYATECKSNRHIVMDFVGGYMTQGIQPSAYAQAMASSLAMDYEEVDAFGEFIGDTSFDEIGTSLEDAYLYYRLLRNDEFEFTEENLEAVITFGDRYCSESDNMDLASKLMVMFQENGWAIREKSMGELWRFVCKYAGFMMFTLFEVFQESLYQCAGETEGPCTELTQLVKDISSENPVQYREFLTHLNSLTSVDQLLLYLSGHPNIHTNDFFIRWFLDAYDLADGLNGSQPIIKLLKNLLVNVSRINGSEKNMVEILFAVMSNRELFESVLKIFLDAFQEPNRLEQLCSQYIEVARTFTDRQCSRFEEMLLEIPKAAPIAVRLCARKIASAKKPDEEFWKFYEYHRSRVLQIDPMVIACLNSIDRGQREEVAADMLKRVDLELISDPAAIRLLTDTLDGCSVKALLRMDRDVLKKAIQLRTRTARPWIEKVRAVYYGEAVRLYNVQRKRPITLSVEVAQKEITLDGLDRTDYDTYVKHFFGEYMVLLRSSEDVAELMRIFYNRRTFVDFTADYISAIKKMERKEPDRWMRMMAWTCVYLLTAEHDVEPAEELYKPMVRYLRSLDDKELMDLRHNIVKEVPGTRCDQLFDEVRRKEGLSERLGSFFHRK